MVDIRRSSTACSSQVLARRVVVARTASPLPVHHHRVAFVEEMSLAAVGFQQLPPHVLSVCDRFEVEIVTARCVAAKVIEFESWWYRADRQFVGEHVCSDSTSLDDELAVPVLVGVSRPHDAAVRQLLCEELQSLRSGRVVAHSTVAGNRRTCAMPEAVVRGAVPSRLRWALTTSDGACRHKGGD